jgi:hypothetical protein
MRLLKRQSGQKEGNKTAGSKCGCSKGSQGRRKETRQLVVNAAAQKAVRAEGNKTANVTPKGTNRERERERELRKRCPTTSSVDGTC